MQDFRLTVFLTVARTLSFTRAASMLNVSQPAVSKHIREMEADFGEPLFNRQGNRISLTDKASEILPLVESIIEGYNALSDRVSADGRGFEGLIHIGASTTIAQYILPSILAQFSKAYPNIRVSLVSANSDEVIRLLQNKQIDLALIEGSNDYNSVHYTPLASDSLVLLSKCGSKRPLSIYELKGADLLIREEGSGTLDVILSELKRVGVSRRDLNIKMQLGSSEAIIRYLKESSAYAFLSVIVAQEHLLRGDLSVVDVDGLDIRRHFRFATLHGQSGRLQTLFIEFCQSHYNF